MSKQAFKFTMLSAGLLSLFSSVTLLSGCGQDRPGVRITESEQPEGVYNPLAEENHSQRLDNLIGTIKGEDPGRAFMAIGAIGRLGAKAEPKLEELRALQDHPDENLAAAIKKAVADIEADIAKNQ